MARIETDPNYTSPTFSRATAATDPFKKEDVQNLAAAVSTHDHSTGKGLPLGATSIPAGSITSAMIANGTITAADIAAGTITSNEIADGTIATADLANASVTNAKLASDTARLSLLTNGGFEIWQRGNGPTSPPNNGTEPCSSADRWYMQQGAGAGSLAISKEASTVDSRSASSAKLVYTAGAGDAVISFHQRLAPSEYPLTGSVLTLSLRVNATVAGRVRPMYFDGSARVYGAANVGANVWETLTLTTAALPSTGVSRLFGLEITAGTTVTVYVDNAMLVVGSQAADYAPLHPADDLARCLRYYERFGFQLNSIYIRAYAFDANPYSQMPLVFRAIKAVTPTMTKSGTFAVGLCGQPVVDQPSVGECRLLTTTTGAGIYSVQSADATCGFTAEANP